MDNKPKNHKAVITEKILNNIDNILSNQRETDNLLNYIQKNEPTFYEWTQKRTSYVITSLSRYTDLRISIANQIAHGLLMSHLGGYLLSSEIDNDSIDNMMQSPEQEFETWLIGGLPSKFYNYPLEKLDKNSTKYIAKIAHTKMADVMEKNKITKNKYLKSKSYDDIKNDIKDGSFDIWNMREKNENR